MVNLVNLVILVNLVNLVNLVILVTMTHFQDNILTENIWFAWSKTSYSGDKRRCYRCGTTKQTLKIELLSEWMIEAEFRNIDIPNF